MKRLIVAKRLFRASSAICDRCPKMSGEEQDDDCVGLLAGSVIDGTLEIFPSLDGKRQRLYSRRPGNRLCRAKLGEPYLFNPKGMRPVKRWAEFP